MYNPVVKFLKNFTTGYNTLMRLHRFIGDFNLSKPSSTKALAGDNEIISKDKELVNQLLKVLRLKTGEKVILCDGNANEAEAEIVLIRPTEVTFKIVKKYKNENEHDVHSKLYLSILKKENFELAVQKAVEIGVSEIIPILTERTIKTGLNINRLKKIIREASEQSGRGIMPNVSEPETFDNAIKEAKKNNDLNLFFDLGGKPLIDVKHQSLKIGIFIGPEGFEICSFGKLVYRAETAAITAVYYVVNLL